MSDGVKYLIAQHLADPLRKEPRNVGVLAQRGKHVASRFVGEDPDGSMDGRRLRRFPFPDVYRQWVEYWKAEATGLGQIELLVEDNNTHYQLVRGGEVLDVGADPLDVVVEYLFTRFVTDAGFAGALEQAAAVEPPQSLSDELEAVLNAKQLLSAEPSSLLVPHPVVRRRAWSGRSRAVHRPQFSQENGRLYLIETFDFARSQALRLHDHAGFVAYMFGDIKGVRADVEAIAVVNVPEQYRDQHQIVNALWMLESEARMVDWTAPGDRDAFLAEREAAAGRGATPSN